MWKIAVKKRVIDVRSQLIYAEHEHLILFDIHVYAHDYTFCEQCQVGGSFKIPLCKILFKNLSRAFFVNNDNINFVDFCISIASDKTRPSVVGSS